MRERLVAGNWKMHGNRASNLALLDSVLAGIGGLRGVGCAVCVPFPYLGEVALRLKGTVLAWGAQNLSEMEDDEADRLDTAWGLTARSRLGCQAVIKGDVVCELPMYTRNYVQEGGGIQLGKSDRKERKAQEVTP